jgi:uncharacterized protein YuzE
MKIEYFPETDSLCIELSDRPGSDTREIEEGIVLDIDDQSSKRLSINTLNLRKLPFEVGLVV